MDPFDRYHSAGPETGAPQPLQDILFGTPSPCFAIIDAAGQPHLPEGLTGLDHANLFQGQAATDYADVAPYVAKLDPRQGITRSLFTTSDVPGGLWEAGGAVLLQDARDQPRLDLAEIRSHLRRFTRQRTEQGNWMFVRITDPMALPYYLLGLSQTPERLRAFLTIGDVPLCYHVLHHGRLLSVRASEALLRDVPRGAILLGDPEVAAFRRYRWDRYCTRVFETLQDEYPDEARAVDLSPTAVVAWCSDGKRLGLASEASLYRFAACALRAGAHKIDMGHLIGQISDWPILSQRDQTLRLVALIDKLAPAHDFQQSA